MAETTPAKALNKLFRLLKNDKKEIASIYSLAVVQAMVNLVLPLGIQAIITLIMGGRATSSWVILIVLVTLSTAAAGILQIVQLGFIEVIQQRLFARASFEFAYRIPRLKNDATYNNHPPELVNRFFDVMTIQKALPKVLKDFSTGSVQVLFGLILLSFYHPFFIIFGVLLLLYIFLIFFFLAPTGLATSLQESNFKYKVVYWLEEIARAMTTFKLSGKSDLVFEKLDPLTTGYIEARKEHFRVLVLQVGNLVAFKTIVTAALLIMGGVLVMQRQISLGQFVAAEIVIIILISSLERLILGIESLYDLLTGIEKISAVTSIPLESDEGKDFETVGDKNAAISLNINNLTVQLPQTKRILFDKLSFDIKAGERICLAGHGGVGKSIILKSIAGIYGDYLGSISFNNMPNSNINPETLRYRIGDNLTDESIFEGTLEENITLGRPGINLEQILWAVEKADLKNYIATLNDGFDTHLEPNDKTLPQSVRKRIMIARAIVHKPGLILFDDLNLEMDVRKKAILIDALIDNSWTLIAVTTDKFFAQRCDKIIFIEDGKICFNDSFENFTRNERCDLYFN